MRAICVWVKPDFSRAAISKSAELCFFIYLIVDEECCRVSGPCRGRAGAVAGATECELCRARVAGDAETFVDEFGRDWHGGERRGCTRRAGERRAGERRESWRVKQLA